MPVRKNINRSITRSIRQDVYGNIGLDGRLDNPSKLNGLYRARVEFNQDENGQGRVQVRVPELHGLSTDGVPTSSLPWASLMSSSAGAGYGTYMVPEVGEFVMVQFENGDPYKPVVVGSVYGSGPISPKGYGSGTGDDEKWESKPGQKEVPPENLRQTPSLKTIYKSPTGASISIDEKKGSENILIGDGLGQHIQINTNMSSDSVRKGPDAHRSSEGTSIEMKDYGGQTITMTAKQGKCSIKLKSTDGYEVRIDPSDDGYHVVAKDSDIHIDREGNLTAHAKSVRFTSDSNITFNSKFSTLDIDDSCVINAPNNIDIVSGDNTNIQTSGNVTVNAGGRVKIGKNVTIIDR